jgi:hypothetical protein
VPKSFFCKKWGKSQTDFSRFCFVSRFWAFLGEGGLKTPFKKIPVTFLASDLLTYHGVNDFLSPKNVIKKSSKTTEGGKKNGGNKATFFVMSPDEFFEN